MNGVTPMAAESRNRNRALSAEEEIRLRRVKIQSSRTISSFLIKLVLFIIVIVLLFGVFFGIAPMHGNDMKPSLRAGDLLLYYRMEKSFYSGDLVIYEMEGKQYVGRVIAVGGDTVEVTDQNTVLINGSTIVETDIYYSTPKYEDYVEYPVSLGKDEIFVLCDYRNGGKDSRYFGAIPLSGVKGKIISVLRRSQL